MRLQILINFLIFSLGGRLKSMPPENINLNYSEFSGAIMIKFAYLNGIEIEK